MPTAHLYIFSDACPSDWLHQGEDGRWHTIANFIFQSDPSLQSFVEQAISFEEILSKDSLFVKLRDDIGANGLPSRRMMKWNQGPGYRSRFCKAFSSIVSEHRPIVSALSFQERNLWNSKKALLNSYNKHIGGIEGRGVGFEEFIDNNGRVQMKCSFVNFAGYHEIQIRQEAMLVLLLMSWFIADQYYFYRNEIIGNKALGFDKLALTVVSDKLSGDFIKGEQILKKLIDPDDEGIPIKLTRSPKSDFFFGDLLADNLAGWLNSTISDNESEYKKEIISLEKFGVWKGWHELTPSESLITLSPAISRFLPKEKA